MTRIVWLCCLVLLWPVGSALRAAAVPGRYIVELTTEPVAEHIRRQGRRGGLRGAEATAHRTVVRTEQQQIRGKMRQAVVLGTADTVANALFVEIPDAQVAQLASIPGVRRVLPVRTLRLLLDRAALIDKAADAWGIVGFERAGEGVKIAIIDTGIDSTHAGFQDSSLAVPDSYPKTNSETDLPYTNNKIIVARSYVNYLPYRDPDRSARDRVGHGTALGMAAAGGTATGPLATITGVAPRAWLGNYKVFGTPGFNDTSTNDAIIKAMDDAVADGMDIISLSVGDDLAPRLTDDATVDAVERASQAGVIVVVAAGNNGPQAGTISSPATAPSAIAVGASRNDRTFAVAVQIDGLPPFNAVVGDGPAPAEPVSGPLLDLASIDQNGLGCESLPAGSAQDRIVLILRGSCTFETKLNNAQQAGAMGALVYAAESSPDPIPMASGAATLPAEMISYHDGALVKQALADSEEEVKGTLHFTQTAITIDPDRLADFSAAGPSVDAGLKPDLVAVGADFYTATQTLDSWGDMYDPSGFLLVDGTSFSTPLVAGAAAVVKSARPGLTVDQYRSLLINSAAPIHAAPDMLARIQQAGAGQLDVAAALRATATAYPTALNFGKGGADVNVSRNLTITNVGTSDDIFTIQVSPRDEGPAPAVPTNTIQLAAGASAELQFGFEASGLAAGAHEGFVRVTAASSGTELRVPYWYASTNDAPAGITILDAIASARAGGGSRDAVLFRVTDAAGLLLSNVQPEVTAISGDGSVYSVTSYDAEVPGLFGITLRLGPVPGPNVFRIQAGDAAVEVSISGQ